MKSPFPGMDPYLEPFWSDVHNRIITYMCDAINDQLPGDYRAAIEQRVLISKSDEPPISERRPDVAILTSRTRPSLPGQLALLEPVDDTFVRIMRTGDPLIQRSLKIIDTAQGDRLITAIEVLSPTNKLPGKPSLEYERKLDEYYNADASIVQIDLLRTGERHMSFFGPPPPRAFAEAHYYTTIYHVGKAHHFDVYPMQLHKPLPEIRIPLRQGESEIRVALQPLMDRVYHNGRFRIDYQQPLVPPLSDQESAWLAQRVKTDHDEAATRTTEQ
jgi:hypothetical protein